MRSSKEQEWSGKRKQTLLLKKPEQPLSQGRASNEGRRNTDAPNEEMKDLPPPPEVVIEKKKPEDRRREAAKGEKKYVAPLPGYDDCGASSGNTPL